MMNTAGIKPTKKPPVGPIKIPNPPVNWAKTGIPIAPIIKYKRVEVVPSLDPSMVAANPMARVCPVIGTPKGKGITTCANTLIIAANKAVTIIIRNLKLDSDMMLTSPLNSMLTSFYSGSHSYNSGGDRSLSTPILVEENKNYGLPEFY